MPVSFGNRSNILMQLPLLLIFFGLVSPVPSSFIAIPSPPARSLFSLPVPESLMHGGWSLLKAKFSCPGWIAVKELLVVGSGGGRRELWVLFYLERRACGEKLSECWKRSISWKKLCCTMSMLGSDCHILVLPIFFRSSVLRLPLCSLKDTWNTRKKEKRKPGIKKQYNSTWEPQQRFRKPISSDP